MLTFPLSPRRAALLTALTVILLRAPARATPATSEPVLVERGSDFACGTAQGFLHTVFARTPRARKANDGEAGRTFRVSIRRNDDGRFSGELVVSDVANPSGQAGRRVITGEACSEVFDALALFAALSVDPEASTAQLPAGTASADAPPVAPNETALAPPESTTALRARSPTPARPAEQTPREARPTWHGRGGAHLGVMSAGLRSKLLLVMPFLEGNFEPASASAITLAPAGRLAFSSTGGSTRGTVEGPASLHLTTVRLDVCPVKIELLPALATRPCLALAGGGLRAEGERIAYPSSVGLPWASVGGLARLEWRLFGPFSLEAAAGVDLPVRRNAFHFDPATPIYRVPIALGYASAGVGVDFP